MLKELTVKIYQCILGLPARWLLSLSLRIIVCFTCISIKSTDNQLTTRQKPTERSDRRMHERPTRKQSKYSAHQNLRLNSLAPVCHQYLFSQRGKMCCASNLSGIPPSLIKLQHSHLCGTDNGYQGPSPLSGRLNRLNTSVGQATWSRMVLHGVHRLREVDTTQSNK